MSRGRLGPFDVNSPIVPVPSLAADFLPLEPDAEDPA